MSAVSQKDESGRDDASFEDHGHHRNEHTGDESQAGVESAAPTVEKLVDCILHFAFVVCKFHPVIRQLQLPVVQLSITLSYLGLLNFEGCNLLFHLLVLHCHLVELQPKTSQQ